VPTVLKTGGPDSVDLGEALLRPECYGHPVQRVELIETHISQVFLTGSLAYKIKKRVDLGFLDFTSLQSRRLYCNEELRLNRRTAPDLYIDVVPITATSSGLRVAGAGTVVDYAVRMRQFPQDCLFDHLARNGALERHHVDAAAGVVARFHAGVSRARPETDFGAPGRVLAPVVQNFDQLEALAACGEEASTVKELREWSWKEYDRLFPAFESRRSGGFVRECHGDLHLGNIAFINGQPVPFDCIEFNEELRWIDTMNEVGFLAMDLIDHNLEALASRFVNRYLEITGDYAGLKVLRFYETYRALVRAKVSRMRERQAAPGSVARRQGMVEYARRIELARRLSSQSTHGLVLMHGFSGSGKTTLSQSLVELLHAVRLRSDVERKRLHGLDALARSGSAIAGGIYGAGASERTYGRLAAMAREVMEAGNIAVIDGTFLLRKQRDMFHKLALEVSSPFAIVSCRAEERVLRERLSRREQTLTDASEAGLAILRHQLATHEPLGQDELAHTVLAGPDDATQPDLASQVARRLREGTPRPV
jgi:aminoglycoside phosphotransferase family enzyme/predicted kinase